MSQSHPSLGQPDFDSQQHPSLLNNSGDEHFDDAMDHSSAADEVDQLGTNEDDNNAEPRGINAQDSSPSVIEETQFVPLEVDTQGQIKGESQALDAPPIAAVNGTATGARDSNQSVITDTQFIGLEVDTQAEAQVYDSPVFPVVLSTTNQAAATDNAQARGEEAQDADVNFDDFINAAVYAELPAKATESSRSLGFIERPPISDDQDFGKGFKYGRGPTKHPINRPQPKVSQSAFGASASATATKTRSTFEPDSKLSLVPPQRMTRQN
ncbi:hypothetical protein BKA64DRAFT_391738 [Cadophora sp. MPI-SDFR-AT-0126]|nr:hypothetical protein BKA64DRAFT_391738 [Leotiomycetes sp. MPI-SDFR-AT-0126]